jgi:nucleoside-diphosphate-sugar epimerase
MVTGNMGYIGTVLTPILKARGYDVVGLDSDLYRHCTFGNGLPQIPTIRKDIRDVEIHDLEGIEAICHLAALSNDPLGNLDPELTYDINYRASVRLAELARKAGVQRYVFSSSCSTYGAGSTEQMLTEEAAFNPVTPYGESKVLVEKEVAKMADEDFSPTFLRNATAYGASSRLRFDLVLNNLVAWAFTTGKIMMKSDGSPWRPIVHVEDICLAFAAAIDAPREFIHNRAFNVGVTADNVQIKEIARIVGQVVPECKIEFADGASPDKRCYRVDCSLLPSVLADFKPQWTVVRGAKQLYDLYRRHGLTLEEFEGPRYQRIGQIKKLLDDGVLDKTLRFVA